MEKLSFISYNHWYYIVVVASLKVMKNYSEYNFFKANSDLTENWKSLNEVFSQFGAVQ